VRDSVFRPAVPRNIDLLFGLVLTVEDRLSHYFITILLISPLFSSTLRWKLFAWIFVEEEAALY
jgi:hypothetical protein